MGAKEVRQEADYHRSACQGVAASSQITECRTLALALLDANKWLDAYYTDLQNILAQIDSLHESIDTVNESIENLKKRSSSLEEAVRRISGKG